MALNALSPIGLPSLAVAAAAVALASLVWWRRLLRVGYLRLKVEKIYALSERILDLEAQAAILDHVEREVIEILEIESVQFQNERPREEQPGAVCLPMSFRGEVSGWLVLRGPGLKLLREEESALRHLANQIAIAQALAERRVLQERILRSERQGAVGQLISSIAAELRPPLMRLRDSRDPSRAEKETMEALSVLDRLLAFARPEREQRSALDLAAMIRDLLELRSEAMRLALVRVEPDFIEAPLIAVCSRSQVEQAFLNVLVFAEQSLAQAQHRVIHLAARGEEGWIAFRFRIEVPADGGAEALLAVSRGVIEAHHGDWKMRSGAEETVIEVRLPAASGSVREAIVPSPGRKLTLLAVTPDAAAARQIAEAAAACGHRVVPAAGGSDALLIASRLQFDAIFSVESLPDLEWSEFSSRARQITPAVILLSVPGTPPPDGIQVLRMPLELEEFRAVCKGIASRPVPGGMAQPNILNEG